VRYADVRRFVSQVLADDFHAARVESLADGVMGVIHAAALAVHLIGQGLAQAKGLVAKHAIKQMDRLLSNTGISLERFFARWVPFVLGQREEAVLALDWTEFDDDDHSTLALYLIAAHGRATPMMWMTVQKSEIKGWRNAHEDALLRQFAQLRPQTVKQATVLADRGFGDQKLYPYLQQLRLDFVIRCKGLITVEGPSGLTKTADEWVLDAGRARMISDAKVTGDKTGVPAVVVVHARGMKESWCLATSRSDLTASEVVKMYGKRFRIEENFRDTKDQRFGMGLRQTHIKRADRRDRVLMLATMAQALLTLLGAAAEQVGLDRKLKANTVKSRTHSLLRQGLYWYGAIPTMPKEWLEPLMKAFGTLLAQQAFFSEIFGSL